MSLFSLNRSHWLRNGRSSCINLPDALGFVVLIVVLCEQMDKWENRRSLRRATPSDLSPQRDTSEPPHFYGHTRQARDIRRVSYVSAVLLSYLSKISNLDTVTTALRESPTRSIRYSILTVQPKPVPSAGQSSLSYLPGLLVLQEYWSAQGSVPRQSLKMLA